MIIATELIMKKCAMCGDTKPISEFHRCGKRGHHSYCKPCLLSRPRNRKKTDRTAGNLRRRYGISVSDRDQLLSAQNGKCAICREVPKRPVVDHCHNTGQVRGILCHACNVKLHGIENEAFHTAALAYLGRV